MKTWLLSLTASGALAAACGATPPDNGPAERGEKPPAARRVVPEVDPLPSIEIDLHATEPGRALRTATPDYSGAGPTRLLKPDGGPASLSRMR